LAAGYYYFRPGIQRPQARRRPPRKATRCPGPTRRAWCVCSHLANPPDRANLPRHRHAPSPKLSARTTATPPGRRQSFATAAFRRSPALLNHRHVPWKHSVARTLAPQRHAPASQRHAGVQL